VADENTVEAKEIPCKKNGIIVDAKNLK